MEKSHVQSTGSDDENDNFPFDNWPFEDLPEVILVKIMEYLSLKEKYYLSVTCRRFYELFSHPNLWKRVSINTMLGAQSTRWQFQAVMDKTMCEIVKRFAHLFQHLSLKMSSIIQPFDALLVDMLKDLAQDCRLESLTLEVGLLETRDQDAQAKRNFLSNLRDVHLLTGLLQNAVRLKKLNIISWPMVTDAKENNIFQAILNNDKCKSLQTLSLFFIDLKTEWTGRVPVLPSPEDVSDIISFLPNLTHISLRSSMISDDLIVRIASQKRENFDWMDLLVLWTRGANGFKIPEIRGQSWHQLKVSSPNLKIGIVVHTRIPFDEHVTILKPEVPLASLTVLKYGLCDSALIHSVASKYGDTLQTFTSRCESEQCDIALMDLFMKCENLIRFEYHGSINYQTVIRITKYLKKVRREMKVFVLNEKQIKTDELTSRDDDIVIRRNNETQEYFIASVHAWHIDEDHRRRKLDQMIEYARDSLNEAWKLC